jgi:hypothetical protein
LHAADPCLPIADPAVPEGYETLSAQGVTVAWPPGDGVIAEPTALAYLAAGLLEEAARATGTERRDEVTVIVYGSTDEFHVVGGAPRWSSGRYDGAVKLPPQRGGDFGVRLRTLRHELMHAQLHARVGCMPIWLNEGAAMQFARELPREAWIRALRDGRVIGLARMNASTVEDVGDVDIDAIYAQSLAMVLYAEEPPLRDGLAGVVRALKERPLRTSLWVRVRPEAGTRQLLDAIGQRVFGMPTGPDLDAILRGAVCCHGSALPEFGCRGAPIEPGKRTWIDQSRQPVAICDVDHLARSPADR